MNTEEITARPFDGDITELELEYLNQRLYEQIDATMTAEQVDDLYTDLICEKWHSVYDAQLADDFEKWLIDKFNLNNFRKSVCEYIEVLAGRVISYEDTLDSTEGSQLVEALYNRYEKSFQSNIADENELRQWTSVIFATYRQVLDPKSRYFS